MINRRRPQLRACTVCHKPGHNKSRCPIFLASQILDERPANSAIKMVLHESTRAVRSPHIVDLKPKNNPWAEIGSFAPDISTGNERESCTAETERELLSVNVDLKQKKPAFTKILLDRFLTWRENRSAEKELAKMKRLISDSLVKNDETLRVKTSSAETPIKSRPEVSAPAEPILDLSAIEPEIKSEPEPVFFEPLGKMVARLSWRTAIFLVICIIPFQAHSYYQSIKNTTGKIAAEGTQGFMALQESTAAILAADIVSAESSVNEALLKFQNAIQAMEENHRLLQKIVAVVPIVSNEVQSRQKLITAGQKIALGNQHLINGIAESQKMSDDVLTERIKILTEYLKAAAPNYAAALDDLGSVDAKVLPLEFQASFNDFRLLFAAFLDDLNNFIDLGRIVDEIFGGKGFRRYIIIFQNSHEIRPTGGFLGSFALIDVKDGKIVSLNIPPGGSYSLQGQLDVVLEPPVPLLLSNRRWEFQDANWFADFPASAEKILWFYRHARQVTADGVIAVNASVLERLIAILGPITDEKRSLTFSSSTAIMEIQKIVEEGPEKNNNRPKQIIADLAPQILGYLYGAGSDKTMPLVVSLAEALEGKEIQAYFTDEETEKVINTFGWGGQILAVKPNQDYLMVVNANIQGQKSDAQIKQIINHEAVIGEDGSVIDTIVVTREHTGSADETLYGSANIDYIRIYVPQGSELISAGGFTWPDERKFRAPLPQSVKDEFLSAQEKEVGIDDLSGTRITEEFGKTVFANWLIIEPRETRQIQFTYRLPFKINLENPELPPEQNLFRKIINEDYLTSRYQLIAQKQSGVKSTFESQIIFPAPWHPNWTDGTDISLAGNGIGIGPIDFNRDEIWSLLVRKEIN